MGSPLCSGAIPALPRQSLSQVAGAEAHRVGTDLTPFPLSACSPCPSMGMLPPEWGRGVMMKQGGPLLVSAADRGLSCLLHTACQVPAIMTLSHGTQSQVQVSLVSQSWSLPTPPQASASSALLWGSWGHVDSWLGGWCGLTAVRVLDFPDVLLE